MGYVLHHKVTKVLVTRTLELVPGAAEFTGPRLENGKIVFDYTGGTDVWWEEQFTQRDEKGQRLFLDENGDTVKENDLELVSEEEHENDQRS